VIPARQIETSVVLADPKGFLAMKGYA